MKKKLLLHSCCAPCSSAVIEKLLPDFDITIFYYNPNIAPKEEFEKRLNEQTQFLKNFNIECLSEEYDENEFENIIKGLENEKEGGSRCYKCYELRIKKTFEKAKELGFDYFCTTLSVSPYKNAKWLNEIGEKYQTENVKWLESNFKKQNGYLRSIQLSKQYNLYRQNYCGCKYSKKETI